MKAVNMKNYKFATKGSNIYMMKGFGMYDETTGTFVSHNGQFPYVLETKKMVESCIAAGFDEIFTARIAHI